MEFSYEGAMLPELFIRLILAGVLGGAIGLERAYRAKEAGVRTHFLVALGSALFMMVSQHGFNDVANLKWVGLDPSRVAAQIVSGIGFLGAGTIIFQRRTIKGLTTAAGMWVVAAIGMAAGGGLYILAVAATVLTLIGFEMLRSITARLPGLGESTAHMSFRVSGHTELQVVIGKLEAMGCRVLNYCCKQESKTMLRVALVLRFHENAESNSSLLMAMKSIPGVKLRKLE